MLHQYTKIALNNTRQLLKGKEVKANRKHLCLKLSLGISAYIFASSLMSFNPASAEVRVGYKGGNYAGVKWSFGTVTKHTGDCGSGPCFEQEPYYTVTATIIKNGQVTCSEQHDFSHDTTNYGGKSYWLCGQPAIIHGNYGETMRAYYHAPNGTNEWVDSPAHCTHSGFAYICDHYWYVNW
jgi:hypothetical protein